MHVRDSRDVATIAELLGRLGEGVAQIDEATRRVSVRVDSAGDGLMTAMQSLHATGVELDDIAMRQPNLDEVFLTLTGQATTTTTTQRGRSRGLTRKETAPHDNHRFDTRPKPRRRPPGRQTGLAKSTVTVARRALLRYVRTPQLIVLATIQMSLFFLIYRYMFGGAIHIAGMPYVDYLVPGFIATGVLFSGIGTAAAMAEDLEQGFIDRLRSLPIPRAAVLTARALADTALLAWSTAFTTAVAFAVGFSLHGSAIDGLAAFGLVIVFGFAFEWLFITMGLFAGNAQAAQGMGLIVFPFAFVSSAYVPVSSMPSWLQVFANHQPLTYMVDAVRALTLGPHAHALLGHPSSYFVDASTDLGARDHRRHRTARRRQIPRAANPTQQPSSHDQGGTLR